MRVMVVKSSFLRNPVRKEEAQRVTPNAVRVRVAGEQPPQTCGCPRLTRATFGGRPFRWLAGAALGALLWLAQSSSAHAERSVTLSWNQSPGSAVTGYYVYAHEENAPAPTRLDAGNTNHFVLPNLKEGLRYTFTVTAYNAAGSESAPSGTALVVVPVPIEMLSASPTTGLWRIQFPGAPGRSYELQATTDLKTWTTIWQSGPVNTYAPLEFEDPESAVLAQRFYRLLVR
jgi:hypothetical protein